MERILSFGAGLQTTALAIMVAKGELDVDAVVFADTGGEKPETYWLMENYTVPMLREAKVPFFIAKNNSKHYGDNLYDYCWRYKNIPKIKWRFCTRIFKILAIEQLVGKGCIQLIGFSTDEAERANQPIHAGKVFPLLAQGLSAEDCRMIIKNYGFPLPIKSSCFFCPFQRQSEWKWLKLRHPDLFEKALALELRFHKRLPELKNYYGLFQGTPLRRWADGTQMELPIEREFSCWSGYCSH